eukprot:4976752-Amphidinium_carterae.1
MCIRDSIRNALSLTYLSVSKETIFAHPHDWVEKPQEFVSKFQACTIHLCRQLAKNAYFGERALLFDEPRTASIEVVAQHLDCEIGFCAGTLSLCLWLRVTSQPSLADFTEI